MRYDVRPVHRGVRLKPGTTLAGVRLKPDTAHAGAKRAAGGSRVVGRMVAEALRTPDAVSQLRS